MKEEPLWPFHSMPIHCCEIKKHHIVKCSLPWAEEAIGALVFSKSTLHFLQLLVAEDILQITEA